MNIPVYIISYNKLKVLKKCIDELLRFVPYSDIIIIDNASDYLPLHDFYEEMKKEGVTILHHVKLENANDLNTIAPLIEKENKKRNCDYYVVTDSDISLELVKDDFFEVCQYFLHAMPDCKIAGPMLKITDIPSTYMYREYAWKRHVEQFWHKRPESMEFNNTIVYYQNALIDTTFGMLKSSTPYKRLHSGVRLYAPYEAQHLDWYISPNEITHDQYEFLKNTKNSTISHWSSGSMSRHRFEYLGNEHRGIYIVEENEIVKYELEPFEPSINFSIQASLVHSKNHIFRMLNKIRNRFKL